MTYMEEWTFYLEDNENAVFDRYLINQAVKQAEPEFIIMGVQEIRQWVDTHTRRTVLPSSEQISKHDWKKDGF